MKTRNLIVLILFLFLSKFSLAQKSEIINSGDIITKSLALADSGQFKPALALLNKVSRSDTNYVSVLLKKALVCRADSQYNEGVKYCQQALLVKTNHEFGPDIYNAYGSLLLDMGKYDEAIKIFDTGLGKYPEFSMLYFNKGVVYLRLEKPEVAEQWFQKTLLINPYTYSAHYHLALSAVLQGKIVPAYISYMSYLLFSPKGKFAQSSINMLQQISVNTDEILNFKNNRKTYPNANYQAVEDVIFSKIALNKSYEILTQVDDPISRQIQAVIEKLEYTDDDSDFWTQYYLPFLKKVYADKKFDLMINHMFSNVKIPAIEAYVEKNKKQIDVFTGEASVYFDLIQSTRELMLKKRDTTSTRFFYEDGALLGRGTLSKTGKILLGAWTGYYPGGNIKSQGIFNSSGQRSGSWTWFNYKGAIKAKENYLNGKLAGQQEYYFANGNKSSVENYINGQLQGTITVYTYGGSIKSVSNYKAGKLDGEEKNYYNNGDLESEKNYTSGALNGNEKAYFKNRKLKSVVQYINGKAEGSYKEYNNQGILVTEGNFLKDLTEGEWKYYDDHGKIKQSSQRHAGIENGPHKEYYPTGELSSTYNAVKDKIDGELLEYYKDGKIFSKRTYENGALVKASYLDKSGNALSSLISNGETSKLISYGNNGLKKSSLTYKAGVLNGLDTIYYNSGKINQILNYKDGLIDGKVVTYYQNGKIKSETTMTDDKTNGYYTSFYMNGNIETEGWMVEDQYQGPWSYYNENGKLNSTQYYLAGDIDGYKEEYFANGQKSVEYKYYRGWLEEVTNYDEQGKVIATDIFDKGQGKFKLLHPNGKLMAETNYKNGEFDGVFKSYYFDGSPERIFYYKSGLLDSTYVNYLHGGIKSMEGKYANGEKIGVWKFYDEDGKISRTYNYSGDKLNGEYTRFFENGNKKYVSYIKDDLYQGYGKMYDPKGALAYQILFNDDLAVSYSFNDSNGKLQNEMPINNTMGVVKAFFANGKPSRECTYLGGERHGDDRVYYENGNLLSDEHLEYNVSEGAAKTYYESGKIKTDFNYLNDNEHGLCKTYNENGSIKRETNYEYGVIQGPVKIYNENGKLLQTKNYEQGVLKSVKYE
ncbi:tetratricopeptide repeat protein [Pedobacter sp. LMG 31464]|uniref:Tetratricopeptide repeat protein n=1 Tax=Pedobacter planticolens TaxID=2679964 RepID=A0A923IUA1_9SPHI|nr:tetratricopeptide repeat protein [Pedobacter planticolens]MBB2144661.1 tetratricopeptide repeat protein [Pedobacter planticolens]